MSGYATGRVEPLGMTFDTAPGLTVLQAAELGGIELPSSCRNGTCRTCICQLTSGAVRYRIDWPGLSAEEKAEGWILPCVAEAIGDITLKAPDAKTTF